MKRVIYTSILTLLGLHSPKLLAQAPPNDNRSSATSIAINETIEGTLQNATTEENEPLGSTSTRTVWYQWTATTGASEFRLTSESARVIALAYLEDQNGNLTAIGRTAFYQSEPGDGSPENPRVDSRAIRLSTQADEIIWFQIYNISATIGDFSLKLSPSEIVTEGDNFQDATDLPANVDQHILDLTAATLERLEPPSALQGTIWRRWTLPQNGPWLITAHSLSGAASLDLWQGDSLAQLSPRQIASNSPQAPKLVFDGPAGESIWIRIATDSINTANLTITRPTPGDLFAYPTDLGEITETIRTFPLGQILTIEPGEPNAPNVTRWLTWKAPSSGVYELSGVAPRTSSGSYSIRGIDPFVNVFTGDQVNQLTTAPIVPFNFQNPFLSSHRFRRFRATAGTTYHFQTGTTSFRGFIGYDDSGGGGLPGFPTELTLTLKNFPNPLPNDDFAQAQDWGRVTNATAQGSNIGASNEEGEIIEQYRAGNSVWHRWTPAETGPYELGIQSGPGLQFTLFRGEALDDLTVVKSQNFSLNPLPPLSGLRFQATTDEVHYLRVTSPHGSEGNYQLSLLPAPPPPNDAFSNAPRLQGDLPLTANGTTRFASLETPVDGSQSAVNSGQSSSIWWQWIPTENGAYELQADAHLGLFQSPHSGTNLITAAYGRLRFTAFKGQVYRFRIAHPRENERPVSLTLDRLNGLEHASRINPIELDSDLSQITPLTQVLAGPAIIDNYKIMGRALFSWTPQSSGWVKISSLEGTEFTITASHNPFYYETQALLENLAPLHNTPELAQGSDRFSQPYFQPSAPLRTSIKIRPHTVPLKSKGYIQVEAGAHYYLHATPISDPDTLSENTTSVQLKITRIAAPPTYLSAQWKRLPNRNFIEATVSISAPNGLSSGSIDFSSNYQWFDAAQRISGDAYNGQYRVIIPVTLGSRDFQTSPTLTLRDQVGVSRAIPLGEITVTSNLSETYVPDLNGPQLLGITGTTPEISLTGSEISLTLEMAITDHGGSGFSSGEIILPGAFIQTALGQVSDLDSYVIPFGAAQRIAGDSHAGLYQIQLTIPATAVPGTLTCRLRDHAGNITGEWRDKQPGDLYKYNFHPGTSLPISLVRENLLEPEQALIDSPEATLINGPTDQIQTTARLSHPLGISRGRIVLQNEFGVIIANQNFDEQALNSGTLQDGEFQTTLPLPAQRIGGTHWITWEIIAQDGATALTSGIGPLEISDQQFGDKRNPLLTRFEITPAQIDLAQDDQTIRINLAAHDDFPGLTAHITIFDHEGNRLASKIINCGDTALDCNIELTLPQTPSVSSSSQARIQLDLKDASGRITTYRGVDSYSWPDNKPPSLTLHPSEPDFLTHWYHQWTSLREIPPDQNHDHDNDGWTDLLEFALATDPSTPAPQDPFARHLPSLTFNGKSSDRNQLVHAQTFSSQIAPWFTINPDLQLTGHRFQLTAESSNDLLNWETLDFGFAANTPDPSAISINQRVPVSQRTHWYRLHIQPLEE